MTGQHAGAPPARPHSAAVPPSRGRGRAPLTALQATRAPSSQKQGVLAAAGWTQTRGGPGCRREHWAPHSGASWALPALSQARPPWQLLDGQPEGPPQPGGHFLLVLTLSPPPAPREGAGGGGEPEDWDPRTPGGHPETGRAAVATFLKDLWAQHLGKSVPSPAPYPGPRPAATRSKANLRRGQRGRALLAKARNSPSRTGSYLCRSQEDGGPLPAGCPPAPSTGPGRGTKEKLIWQFPWPRRHPAPVPVPLGSEAKWILPVTITPPSGHILFFRGGLEACG